MNPISQRVIYRAFGLFQFSIGSTAAKRNLVLQYYSNQKHILEAGCSTGNIVAAFPGWGVEHARQ